MKKKRGIKTALILMALLLCGCSQKERTALSDAWGVFLSGFGIGEEAQADDDENAYADTDDESGDAQEVVGADYSEGSAGIGNGKKPGGKTGQSDAAPGSGAGKESGVGKDSGSGKSNAQPEKATQSTAAAADKGSEAASAVKESDPAAGKAGSGAAVGSTTAYYRSLLGDEEAALYDQMLAGLQTFAPFMLDTVDDDEIERLFYLVLGDHPEIFYVEGYETSCKELAGKRFDMEFTAKNTMSEGEAQVTIAQTETEANRILSGMRGCQTDYDKILYLHDYLVTHTDYGSADNDQNIPSVLLHHKSVCAGYARTMQYLLQKAGIETAYVWGKATNGETAETDTHAWNLVLADGDWYYLDATYDDANFTPENEYQSDYIRYTYFLVTGEQLFRSHVPAEPSLLPSCIATADNYFVKEDRIFYVYDQEALQTLFSEERERGASYVWFKCSDFSVYSEMQMELIDLGKLTELVQSGHATYYHTQPDELAFMIWLL